MGIWKNQLVMLSNILFGNKNFKNVIKPEVPHSAANIASCCHGGVDSLETCSNIITKSVKMRNSHSVHVPKI